MSLLLLHHCINDDDRFSPMRPSAPGRSQPPACRFDMRFVVFNSYKILIKTLAPFGFSQQNGTIFRFSFQLKLKV